MAYVLDRNPCGSSSGSGVIASADLAVAAVGTETDGSIVCPSGANANVGIKPTLGLLSRAGVVPISADQDTAGPMARNVTDAAVLLGAMTGVDPDDPATAEQVGNAFTDYTQFLDANALQGARIGVWREFSFEVEGVPVDEDVSAIMDDTIAALEAAGATVVDPADITFGDWAGAEFPALLCEFKTDIATYLETYTGAGYPEDAPGPDRLQQRQPGSRVRGAGVQLELADLRPRPGDGRPRRRLRRAARDRDSGRPGGDRRPDGQPRTSTRSSRRPTDRPGSPTRSTATSVATSRRSSDRRVRPPSPVTRTSRCPRASSGRCRSACRSSAAAGTSRR